MLSRSASDGHEEKSVVDPVRIVHSHQNALELLCTGDGNSGSESDRHAAGEDAGHTLGETDLHLLGESERAALGERERYALAKNNGGCGSGGRVGGAPLRGGDPERSLLTSKDDAVLEATAAAIKRRLLPLVRRGLREMLAVLEEEEGGRVGRSDSDYDQDADRGCVCSGTEFNVFHGPWPGDADQHQLHDKAAQADKRPHDREDDADAASDAPGGDGESEALMPPGEMESPRL